MTSNNENCFPPNVHERDEGGMMLSEDSQRVFQIFLSLEVNGKRLLDNLSREKMEILSEMRIPRTHK